MTPLNNMKTNVKPSPKKFCATMKLLPIALLMTIWTGCTHYKVIDADKAVRRLKAEQAFITPVDGWFVPDARWLEIREAIADKIEMLEKTK